MATITQSASLDFQAVNRILNLPDAATAQEPATLAQLNSAVEGLNWKDNCLVSTQGNIDLSAPGATIDGIAMTLSDRVLVRAQTAGQQNGIYLWNGASTPMTRALDANTAEELEQAITTIEEGTSTGVTYRQTVINATIDTTPLVWTTFGTVAAPASETVAGIAEIATQAETDTGTDDTRIVTPLKQANWSGRKRKHEQTFGDGAATQFTITHNFATRAVQVEVYRNSGNYDTVVAGVERTSTDAVRITMTPAPSADQFAVVILA